MKKKDIPVMRSHNNDLSKRWYVSFHLENKFVRVYCGGAYGMAKNGNLIMNKAERLAYFAELLTRINNSNYTAAPTLPFPTSILPIPMTSIEVKTKTLTLDEAFDIMMKEKAKELRLNTIREYGYRIGNFLKCNGLGLMACDTLTTDHVRDYLSGLPDCSFTNYNNIRRSIRVFVNFMVDRDYILVTAVKPTKKRTGSVTSNKAYSIPEASRILIQLREHNYFLWCCCLMEYYCFMRPCEIHLLRFCDLDYENMTVTVQSSASKSKISRTLPLHRAVGDALRVMYDKALDLNGYVFVSDVTKRHVGVEYFRTEFYKIKQVLGVPEHCTLYSFKHTGCSELYKATKDIYLVSRLCGHSSIAVTEVYLRSLNVLMLNDSTSMLPMI